MIVIINAHPRLSVPVRILKKRVLPHLDAMGIRGRVTVRLTDDDEVKGLNRSFRKQDKPTDVLSFPILESFPDGFYQGDIIISLDRAFEQAQAAGHEFPEEVQLLLIHGLLHLGGRDHETDSGEMAELQEKIQRTITEEGK